jgi:hypothetical protein
MAVRSEPAAVLSGAETAGGSHRDRWKSCQSNLRKNPTHLVVLGVRRRSDQAMMWAGLMRRCASRVAMRRISRVDQPTPSGSSSESPAAVFFLGTDDSRGSGFSPAWRKPASPAGHGSAAVPGMVPLRSRPGSFSSVTKSSSMIRRRPATANSLNVKYPKEITNYQQVWPTPQLPSREPLRV